MDLRWRSDEEHEMAELVRLVMWSLVWIVTGGGLGDDPDYVCPSPGQAEVWRSWKESA